MRDLQLVLSSVELRVLRIWADATINGGHWGDGSVILPDEVAANSLLDAAIAGVPFLCNPRQVFTFLVWSDESSDTPEEVMLKEKLEQALASSGMAPPLL
jgi:hypothetical protein